MLIAVVQLYVINFSAFDVSFDLLYLIYNLEKIVRNLKISFKKIYELSSQSYKMLLFDHKNKLLFI